MDNANANTNQGQGAQQGQQRPAQQEAQQPRQQVQTRPCPKDCRKCSWQQQVCCASMLSFQSFDVMNAIIQRLDIQSQRIAELETKIAAIQSSEAELSSPLPFHEGIPAGTE